MKELNRIELARLRETLDIHHLDFMPKAIVKWGDNVYAQILAYKNARTDMFILDEVCGPNNWQNEYKRDSTGVLQCGIGVYCGGQWVWKWSNGTPSQFEKEKGEYSDAFKRAGYMWGIGRCLYDFPRVNIPLTSKEYIEDDRGKIKASGFLKPNSWEWDIWIDENGIYEQIVVTDSKGNIRFNLEPHKQRFKDPNNKLN